MDKKKFDLIVIGSGPGGYVAAIRAASNGAKVALIEEKQTGGTCLNRGCIPSKALIASADSLRNVKEALHFGVNVSSVSFDYRMMKDRKDKVVEKIRRGLEGLIGSNKIEMFRGRGKFVSPTEVKVVGENEEWLEAPKIIIATGSEPRELPLFPFDYKTVHDSTSFLNLEELPKRLVIIGGGVIGSEFASLHAELGVEVTILELLPSLLPNEPKAVSEALASAFKKKGIKVETGVKITGFEKSETGLCIALSDDRAFEADLILVAVGRKYNSDDIGLEKTGVIVEKNGSIAVNDRLETTVPGIYAIGDITGKWLLAHVASHQGIVAADNATGHAATMDYTAIPSVIFTHPEIATIGLSLEKAKEQGFDAEVGKFPFSALGKSQATIETDGFAQIVISQSTGEILGAQVVGFGAATLIAEMALAMGHELTVDDIQETVHAHPTIAEAWMEAAFVATNTPIHLPPKAKK